ncbi:MAG: WD40 repeat domain-containing protein [Anaerolineae bacterium]|nr:WD40 repeat domain-containing protein [Anaerolineae bacterium]
MKRLIYAFIFVSLLTVVFPVDAQDISKLVPISVANASKLKIITSLKSLGSIGRMAWSPDGNLLAISTSSNVWLYDLSSNNLDALYDVGGAGIAFSPDGLLLAVGGTSPDNVIRLVDAKTRGEVRTMTGHSDSVTGVAFSPDGKKLASSGREADNTVRLWNVDTGENITVIEVPDVQGVFSVAFSPDGKWLAYDSFRFDLGSGKTRAQVTIWNVESQSEQTVLGAGQSGQPSNVLFSADGKLLITDSLQSIRGHSAYLWNPATGKLIRNLTVKGRVLDSNASGITINADASVAATGHWNGAVRLWNTKTGTQLAIFEGAHERYIYSVSFNPHSTLLASSGQDGIVKLWGITS